MLTEAPHVVGILAVGAEGMSEIQGQDWWRESSKSERAAFEQACRQSIRRKCGDRDAEKFKLSTLLVDGTGRPYWIVSVLANAPEVAQEKARTYSRCLRPT